MDVLYQRNVHVLSKVDIVGAVGIFVLEIREDASFSFF